MRSAAVLLICTCVAISASASVWRGHALMPGTDFATWYYTFDTGKPGPRILLFAPHSDEQSAGQYLESFIRTRQPDRGYLVACPWPVAPARRINTRSYIEDINRQFGLQRDNYTAIDLLAHHVRRWIETHRINFVLNLHEGWNQFRTDWNEYGQSFFIDLPELIPLAERVAGRVNARIWAQNRFVVVQKPMPDTLTWYCATRRIPAFGIEIERGLALDTRLVYQRVVLEEFFRELGVRLVPRG